MILAQWKSGSRYSADAQKIYSELQEIGNSYTPQDIVKMASDPSTEMHKCFQWDDTKAAEQYRLVQARHMVRDLVITVQQPNKKQPEEIRLIQHTKQESYAPVSYIVSKPDLYQSLLEQAKIELKAFKKRYSQIAELAEIMEDINKIIE